MWIALADSDEQQRSRLRDWLSVDPELSVADTSLPVEETVTAIERAAGDIILLQAREDQDRTIAALVFLHSKYPASKIVLLVSTDNQNFFVRAVRAGCRGILNKDSAPELYAKCICKVHEGELWLDRVTTAQVLRQYTEQQPPQRARDRDPRINPLSPREREIVALVIQGYKNKELAEKLTISEQTVKNHMHNIFDKLGVSDRLELALFAIHSGLHEQNS